MYLPRQALLVEHVHERIRVQLFSVPNTWLIPDTLQYHGSANHSWNAGGVGDRLRTNFRVTLFVITDVVNVVGFLTGTVFCLTGCDVTNTGFTFCQLTQITWIRKNGFEELQRNDLFASCMIGLMEVMPIPSSTRT